MDAVQAEPNEPPRKKAKSDGCSVCRPGKDAKMRDPTTGRWYCWLCLRDARPDLWAKRGRLKGQTYPLRCYVCFATDDVTESDCELKQSASCGVARLCSACRSMHMDARCFSCWAISGTCYKCGRDCSFQTIQTTDCRLCQDCRASTSALACFFCRRSESNVRFQVCSSRSCSESVPMCPVCRDVHGVSNIVCRSCFAQSWHGRCYRCREAWARRSQSQFCNGCYSELFPSFADLVAIGVGRFRSLPPYEWNKR